MGVTKPNILQALTTAALALPGLLQTVEAVQIKGKPSFDFQHGYYQESNDRISVDVFQGAVILPISKAIQMQTTWVVDTFSGATPVLTMPHSVALVTTGASGISDIDASKSVTAEEQAVQVMTGASTHESRYGIDLGFSYIQNNLTYHASGSYSEEPDYLAHAYQLGIDWEFNKKLNTLSLGIGQNFDTIEPSTRLLSEQKTDYHLQLGFSQIVSTKSLLQLSTNYTYSNGFLSNPYKKVFIQGLGSNTNLQNGGFTNVFYENRPDKRHKWSVSLGYIQYFSDLDSALHLDYRYYNDSWEISSHTLEAVYHQPLSNGWMLIPRLRYYTQSEANFYQNFYAFPQTDNHYSSDFRLAGFGTLSGGVKLSKEWQRASKYTESIMLEVGFEYTSHASALKLGNNTASEITDFDYVLFTSAIKIKF